MAELDQSSRPRKFFGAWAPWGVPLSRLDRRIACEELRDRFLKHYGNTQAAMEHILQKNAEVVSRCSVLMSFAGILMAVSLFVAVNPRLLPAVWQKVGFYSVMAIWAFAVLRMLASLIQFMPPPSTYATEEDFLFTADLYLWRMARYNFALVASECCFVSLLLFVAPFHATIADHLFGG